MEAFYDYLGYKEECKEVPITFPGQHQDRMPGYEYVMKPLPVSENPYACKRKLYGKTAIITGGDSGIGRAVAYAFVSEGARVAIVYLNEDRDAEETKSHIEEMGGECLLIRADLRREDASKETVRKVVDNFGRIDILVNNNGIQFVQNSIEDITEEQLENTFRTNIYSFFFMTKAALPHMPRGSSIINTTSVTAYEGEPKLLDYSATKGAIMAFTRSLSQSLLGRDIRVNGVAPGPVWTPLIPASFSAEEVETFGTGTSRVPMMRAGQPCEMAPSYVFLASEDASYMTGQVLHPNGGTITGS